MTKTQIWTSAFLAVFIVLFFLQRATMKDEAASSGPMTDMPSASSQKTYQASGEELVKSFGCQSCHGSDLKGTGLAPALVGLSSYYDRDKLTNYLRNPNSFMDQDRFVDFKQKYRNIVMPAYSNKDVKDLGKIADYLLGLN